MNKKLIVLLEAIEERHKVYIRTEEGELITGIAEGCSKDRLIKVRHKSGIDLIPLDGINNVVMVIE